MASSKRFSLCLRLVRMTSLCSPPALSLTESLLGGLRCKFIYYFSEIPRIRKILRGKMGISMVFRSGLLVHFHQIQYFWRKSSHYVCAQACRPGSFLFPQGKQDGHGQQSIEHEEFVAEVVAPPQRGEVVEHGTGCGGCDAGPWHPAVLGGAAGE